MKFVFSIPVYEEHVYLRVRKLYESFSGLVHYQDRSNFTPYQRTCVPLIEIYVKDFAGDQQENKLKFITLLSRVLKETLDDVSVGVIGCVKTVKFDGLKYDAASQGLYAKVESQSASFLHLLKELIYDNLNEMGVNQWHPLVKSAGHPQFPVQQPAAGEECAYYSNMLVEMSPSVYSCTLQNRVQEKTSLGHFHPLLLAIYHPFTRSQCQARIDTLPTPFPTLDSGFLIDDNKTERCRRLCGDAVQKCKTYCFRPARPDAGSLLRATRYRKLRGKITHSSVAADATEGPKFPQDAENDLRMR